MELITKYISEIYPYSHVKNISDVVYRVNDAFKSNKYMLKLGLNNYNFVVIENRDIRILYNMLNMFYKTPKFSKEYVGKIKYVILRGAHQIHLTKVSDDLDFAHSFKKSLNTTLSSIEDTNLCNICFDMIPLGVDKQMCCNCCKSLCEKCFDSYIYSGNAGWCPLCREHMIFKHIIKPEDCDLTKDEMECFNESIRYKTLQYITKRNALR